MDHMLELTRNAYSSSLKEKSLPCDAREQDHSFSSVEMNVYWTWIVSVMLSKRRQPEKPDVTVGLEVRDDDFVVKTSRRFRWFSLGCQAILSLISGGFDSSVSTYRASNAYRPIIVFSVLGN